MIGLAARLAGAALRGLARSLRIETLEEGRWLQLRASGRPVLLTVWHGRMLVPVLAHRDQAIIGLVSLSRDGDFAAALIHRLGYRSVRGSSSRGGREAFHELQGRLAPGAAAAIIPDGPRGPARRLKPGILRLAARTGAAILPLGASARGARHLRSWDRFLLPYPFARAVLAYGSVFEVPGALSPELEEQQSAGLEQELDRLQAMADARLGLRA